MELAKQKRLEKFKDYKYGFFVHYVWGGDAYTVTIHPDGSKPAGIDDLLENFDVDFFADQMKKIGVQYVIFTAYHAAMNTLFPSKTMDKYLPGHTAKKDFLAEIIAALKARNIDVMLYTHPRDGHDLRSDEAIKVGWASEGEHKTNGANPDFDSFNYEKWNDFVCELYEEIVERYGNDIIGLYIDEGDAEGKSESVVDYERLEKVIHKNHPHLVTIQNFYGTVYTCDIGDKEYSHWAEFAEKDGRLWPCYSMCVGAVMGSQFWPLVDKNSEATVYTPEDLFRYTVLQAAANTDGGGVQWAAGPYTDGSFEKNVIEDMEKVYGYIKPIENTILNTRPSTSFVTKPGTRIADLQWGVATKSGDDAEEYLHVLIRPDGKILEVDCPMDNKIFSRAQLYKNGHKVDLQYNKNKLKLILSEEDEWDEVDTVILLR